MVYPPVDTEFFSPAPLTPPTPAPGSRYALVVSALVPYKGVALAIDACRLAGIPLKIAGDGPERARLERAAGSGVTFLGRVSDEDVRHLYRGAAVTLLPGEEDFGIVPVEAQACGCPVVALGRGGALETVLAGQTGLLVEEASPRAFADAIRCAIDANFDPAAIRGHAERFGRQRFGDEMAALIAAHA